MTGTPIDEAVATPGEASAAPGRDVGMSGYTPGPWKACPPRFGNQFVRQDPKDWDGQGYQLICTLPQSTKGTHYGEMFEANARLIAAAPELLATAKELDRLSLAIESAVRACDASNHDAVVVVLRENRAAIAKATKPSEAT